ncbi:hypothetical protein CK203_039814 [Vitis vinifera]|uniref:Uncharacterized protein n=1 Tax=Vitis vinifera TaxID=29760 RepID=A0A438HQG7_VITVI|nr:hypothetical protein CK203_039814 [Vitis vinifera]
MIGKVFFTYMSPLLMLFMSLTYIGPYFNLLHLFLTRWLDTAYYWLYNEL